ncbi:hypothetical protein tpqmel_0113 [Candidatus Gastranaerophilus sp. (ex Termes propinquus)]|nr:hypothetical protein tpqmel_0113 [Candidatus Gastranaerophilus sp. (ex Termes propinquus)]
MSKKLNADKLKCAKHFFYERSYKKAGEAFSELDMPYESGLCELLLNKPKNAYATWEAAESFDFALSWGLIVCTIVDPDLKHEQKAPPTYFQLRAFFEVYLNLFIENKLFAFAESLINSRGAFVYINQEIYKFIARALFSNGHFRALPDFIKHSKEHCYCDPEIHFIEAQMHFEEKNYKKALTALGETLLIAPGYYPALSLEKEILQI